MIMDPSSTNNRSRTDQSDKPNQHKTNLSEKSTIIIFILNQNKSEPFKIPITKHAVNINANTILFVLLEYIYSQYIRLTFRIPRQETYKKSPPIWQTQFVFLICCCLESVRSIPELRCTPACPRLSGYNTMTSMD